MLRELLSPESAGHEPGGSAEAPAPQNRANQLSLDYPYKMIL